MGRRKIGLLILFFLMSFVSLAFASMTIFLPLEKNQTFKESYAPSEIKKKQLPQKRFVQSYPSLNYRAWRHIQASA